MEDEADYELRLTHILLGLRRSIQDGDSLRDRILPHGDLFCLSILFPRRGFQSCVSISRRPWASRTGFEK